jgi:hypothetical protein
MAPNGDALDWAQSVRQLIALSFDSEIRIYPRESNPSVGTTVIPIGTYSNVRVAVTVSNPGSNSVYLGYSGAISTTFGFELAAHAWLSWNWYLDGEIVMQQLFAVAAGSGNKLYVVESALIGA